MKKMMTVAVVALTMAFGAVGTVAAQEAAAATGQIVTADGKAAAKEEPTDKTSFWVVITGSGWLGVFLWLALFGCGFATTYFIIDGFILVRPKKIMPQALIDQVQAAMGEGDVMKALDLCAADPSSMSKILTAGFSHVEEGFDIIEESIQSAADLEVEGMMQRLNWISVCANLAPMLGLLGTVQGMILCFADLAMHGAGDIGALSLSISQALYTTAGGLTVAIPSVAFFYALRNNANRLILRMQVITMDLVKNLRNVEVVSE